VPVEGPGPAATVKELVGVVTVAGVHADPAGHGSLMMLRQLTVVARLLPSVSGLSCVPFSELLNAWTVHCTCAQLCGAIAVTATLADSPEWSEMPFTTTCPLLTVELPPAEGLAALVTVNPGGGCTVAALSGFALDVLVKVTVYVFVPPGATDPGETVVV
jgi:hypothetical protein